jgi:hypothetical protein
VVLAYCKLTIGGCVFQILTSVVLAVLWGASAVHAQTTVRVSVDSQGTQANGWSACPSISSDGRFVAFYSEASNLVAGDTNGRSDIFVHDRETGRTTRVSVDSQGAEADERSYSPSISSGGRFVAFQSLASNLVAGDTNGRQDVFVRGPLVAAPIPDIKANSLDGPLTVSPEEPVLVTVSLDPGEEAGEHADWWIAAVTPFGWYTYVYPTWLLGINLCAQAPLFDLSPPCEVFNINLLEGSYTFYFAVDDNADGNLDATWWDSVEVHVQR